MSYAGTQIIEIYDICIDNKCLKSLIIHVYKLDIHDLGISCVDNEKY